jgi:hypothetical protein
MAQCRASPDRLVRAESARIQAVIRASVSYSVLLSISTYQMLSMTLMLCLQTVNSSAVQWRLGKEDVDLVIGAEILA